MLPVVDKPSIQYVVEEAVARRAHRHPHHHRARQAGHRGPLRPQLRARVLPGAEGQARPARGGPGVIGARRHPLHPPEATRSASATRFGAPASTSATSRSRCCSATTSWSTTRKLLRSMLDVHDRYGRVGARAAGGDAARRSRRTAASSPRRSATDLRAGARRSSRSRSREDAPSNLAVIGRYVFTPEIFDALDRIEPGAGGELQLTDAIEPAHRDADGLRPRVHATAATTSARRSTSCGPTSSSRSTGPTSAPSSPTTCAQLGARPAVVIPSA